MSVPASPSKTIVAGDGTTTVFTFQFGLPAGSDGSDVQVTVCDPAGNLTQLSSNYTVNPATSQVTYPVTPGQAPLPVGATALPVGWQIIMARVELLAQNLSLANQGIFSLPAIEAGMDYLMYCIQQLQEQLNRCAMGPINVPGPGSPVVPPSVSTLPFYKGTYAAIKLLAAAAPTTPAWGYASDLNGGQGQLCYYTAVSAVGDGGWLIIPAGMVGGQ